MHRVWFQAPSRAWHEMSQSIGSIIFGLAWLPLEIVSFSLKIVVLSVLGIAGWLRVPTDAEMVEELRELERECAADEIGDEGLD